VLVALLEVTGLSTMSLSLSTILPDLLPATSCELAKLTKLGGIRSEMLRPEHCDRFCAIRRPSPKSRRCHAPRNC